MLNAQKLHEALKSIPKGSRVLGARLGLKPSTVRRWTTRGLPASRESEVTQAIHRSARPSSGDAIRRRATQ